MIERFFHKFYWLLASLLVLVFTNCFAQIQTVELDVGERQEVMLDKGQKATIELLSLKEITEPYFQVADSQIVDAVVRAEVEILVEGKKKKLEGGPFQLPVAVGGVAVLVGCTRGMAGGIFKDGLQKDVRLEVKSADAPWVAADRFVFPIKNYRWHASNYQHTYLGVVPNIARLYYHRGEDMGMIPDLEEVRSVNEGTLIRRPGPEGDKGSNVLWVKDSTGMIVRYVHMNEYNIDQNNRVGETVKQGQRLGLTGNTYDNHRSPSPHLHVSLHDSANSDHYYNSFPMIVAAYRNSFPGELLPIAGVIRHAYAGQEITLDATKSLAGAGRKIKSYVWSFTDGTQAQGPRVSRKYTQPGTYSEELRVADDQGRWDRDFVEVFVLAKNQTMKPPRAWINYYPIRHIEPGDEVRFLIRHVNLQNLTIDYGDGTKAPWTEETRHRYAKPGNYVVTVTGESKGAGPGTFHVRVVVED
ncbi:PKD domain-containing protein [Persicitalea jodogahamensis]|uniref:PKD domain-containing protein n=1 Tax=Persicitalea jodogahamensis TaxID=402147 RepID=A0A8J3D5S3_9BACT|nr:PKD domain-containing protein [Persicitalea jodogahamensis]GHB86999.1 hypothetical protein GCM10007390_48540 [Persicitalea jodogahamensis]